MATNAPQHAQSRDAAQPRAVPPLATMRALYNAGFALVPLGGGADGKAPLVRFGGRRRLPFNVVVKRMERAGSATYGIRTDGLAVVDLDEDTEELRAYAAERFGTFTVTTPRGRHLYFRHGTSDRLPNLRREGVPIDMKGGASAFVVGPGSVRPDGGRYVTRDPLPIRADLAPFRDRAVSDATTANNVTEPSPRASLVPEGERATGFLLPKAREFVETLDSEADLAAELRAAVDWHCDRPETVKDAEVGKIARWAWRLRLENRILGKGESGVFLLTNEWEALLPLPNGSDAIALLCVLRHNHLGRDRRGKPFGIATHAMAEADTMEGWSSSRIHRAKRCLEGVGLVRCTRKGGKHRGASLYVFGRLRPTKDGGHGSVTYLPPMKPERRAAR